MPVITGRSVELTTPWFELVSKKLDTDDAPYYSLRMPDYVGVLALTSEDRVVLVRQFRPAVERYSLELPSGCVDPGETPEQSARRELTEETGYRAGRIELLGSMPSDIGRHENKVWAYLARMVAPPDASWQPEPGIEVVLADRRDLFAMVRNGELDHALNLAVLLMALAGSGQEPIF